MMRVALPLRALRPSTLAWGTRRAAAPSAWLPLPRFSSSGSSAAAAATTADDDAAAAATAADDARAPAEEPDLVKSGPRKGQPRLYKRRAKKKPGEDDAELVKSGPRAGMPRKKKRLSKKAMDEATDASYGDVAQDLRVPLLMRPFVTTYTDPGVEISPYPVWIDNLPYDSTLDDLRGIFGSMGTVTGARLWRPRFAAELLERRRAAEAAVAAGLRKRTRLELTHRAASVSRREVSTILQLRRSITESASSEPPDAAAAAAAAAAEEEEEEEEKEEEEEEGAELSAGAGKKKKKAPAGRKRSKLTFAPIGSGRTNRQRYTWTPAVNSSSNPCF